MNLKREQVRALFDRAKLYECGDDADGYTVTVEHMLDEMFGPEHGPTVESTVDEIVALIGGDTSRSVGITILLTRLAMFEFERGLRT